MAIQKLDLSATTEDITKRLVAENGIVVIESANIYPKDKRILGSSSLRKKEATLYLPTIKKAAKFCQVPYAQAKQWVLLHEIVHIIRKIPSNQTPFDEAVVDERCKKLDKTYRVLSLPTIMDKEDRDSFHKWLKKSGR